jgi:hypothetical protein
MIASPKTELYGFAHDMLSFVQEKIAEAQSVVSRDRGAANASLDEALGALPSLRERIGSAGAEHLVLRMAVPPAVGETPDCMLRGPCRG